MTKTTDINKDIANKIAITNNNITKGYSFLSNILEDIKEITPTENKHIIEEYLANLDNLLEKIGNFSRHHIKDYITKNIRTILFQEKEISDFYNICKNNNIAIAKTFLDSGKPFYFGEILYYKNKTSPKDIQEIIQIKQNIKAKQDFAAKVYDFQKNQSYLIKEQ